MYRASPRSLNDAWRYRIIQYLCRLIQGNSTTFNTSQLVLILGVEREAEFLVRDFECPWRGTFWSGGGGGIFDLEFMYKSVSKHPGKLQDTEPLEFWGMPSGIRRFEMRRSARFRCSV